MDEIELDKIEFSMSIPTNEEDTSNKAKRYFKKFQIKRYIASKPTRWSYPKSKLDIISKNQKDPSNALYLLSLGRADIYGILLRDVHSLVSLEKDAKMCTMIKIGNLLGIFENVDCLFPKVEFTVTRKKKGNAVEIRESDYVVPIFILPFLFLCCKPHILDINDPFKLSHELLIQFRDLYVKNGTMTEKFTIQQLDTNLLILVDLYRSPNRQEALSLDDIIKPLYQKIISLQDTVDKLSEKMKILEDKINCEDDENEIQPEKMVKTSSKRRRLS